MAFVGNVFSLRSCGECPPAITGVFPSGPVRVQAPRLSRRGPASVSAHTARSCSILGPPAIQKPSRGLSERERTLERLPDPRGVAPVDTFDDPLESRAPTRQSLRSTDHVLYHDAEMARPRSDDEDDRPQRGGNYRGAPRDGGARGPGQGAGGGGGAPASGAWGGRAQSGGGQLAAGSGGRGVFRGAEAQSFSPVRPRQPQNRTPQPATEGLHSSDSENDGVSERRLAKAWGRPGGGARLSRGSGGAATAGRGRDTGLKQQWPPPPGQSAPPRMRATMVSGDGGSGSPTRNGGLPTTRRP